jgi:N-acetylmuramoyl-L-alanine amidase
MRHGIGVWMLAALVLVPAALCGQKTDFSGIKIFVNPGHGGYDGDDRHMIATDFWESEGNLEKGLFLRQLLEDRNATVYMSRTTNFTSDDLPLSSIATMANTANVDVFLSIHSNGFDGTRNQPLMLFRGYDNAPVYTAAKSLAHILWEKIYEKSNCWTHSAEWVKGDWTFYPEWGSQVGLGVLRTLNMPGVLSEGSYHDYIPEGWRLRNANHLHHESWAILRALQQHFGVAIDPSGIIAGTVRDELTSPPYYFGPGTRDRHAPVNGATVTLNPLGISVTLDNLNNGFFMFDSLPPGNYELIVSGMADFYNDTIMATVTAGKTTLADFLPSFDTARVPVVAEHLPAVTDSLPFNQVFSFSFNVPMDRETMQTALVFEPAANVVHEWDEKSKVLTVRPQTGFAAKTPYLIRLTPAVTSRWGVHLAEEYQVSFITKARPKLVTEKIWPSDGAAGVTLHPRITLRFDAPLDQAAATAGIRLLDSQLSPLTKLREAFISDGGKGTYSFELSSPLQRNSIYRIEIDASVKDVAGVTAGTPANASFTTRAAGYQSGNVVESFDNIGSFWDPEASGSTVGTDNPLTTFTASTDIYKVNAPAGRLDYVFTAEDGGVCRVFDTGKPSIGSNTSQVFAMWVYGDLSNNHLEFWFYSPGSVNQIVEAARINWAGWDLISIPLSSIGGSGEWQYHSVVVRQSSEGLKSGTIYFDDAMVITPTGIGDTEDDGAKLSVFPNPLTSEGRITFFLQSAGQVVLDLFASDGSLAANVFSGSMDAGPHSLPWSPSPAITPGVYTLRLSHRAGGEAVWRNAARRWVIMR